MAKKIDFFNNDLFKKSNQDIAKKAEEIWGIYTEEEKKIIEKWNEKIGKENALNTTVFKDASFLREFLKKIPVEEQYNYVENTYNYGLEMECNHEYVILTRRAIPSEIPKREGFWTSEHRTALSGLKKEIPESSPERLHSVIMVTTLKKLEEHGIDNSLGLRSDGEIRIDAKKTFSDFLFMYKPENEKKKLKDYLEKGGLTRQQVLDKHKRESDARRKMYENSYNVQLNDLDDGRISTTKLGKQVVAEMIDIAYSDETEKQEQRDLENMQNRETQEK